MSMPSNSQFDTEEEPLVNDINMTPFIDVMLVLLIVFMVTLPVINHAVKVTLPKENAAQMSKDSNSDDISIMSDGTIAWNKKPVDDEMFKQMLTDAAKLPQAPSLRIYADQNAQYGRVAFVMTTAQSLGLNKFDFVVDSPKK